MSLFTYRTQATAVGGRQSAVASADGSLRAQLSAPRERGGAGGPGTNAEQLFASAFAASFLEALKAAAADAGVTLARDANVTVTVGVDDEGETPALTAHLSLDLPGLDRVATLALARKAHQACPYVRMLPGHFDIQVSVL
jgi:Ohr subfamily peroxiredoxin